MKLLLAMIATCVLAILLAIQAPFLNGPYYWKWPWRRLDAVRYFPAMAACVAPMAIALLVRRTTRLRTVLAVFLVMLSMFAIEIVHVGMTVKPFSLSRIVYFVQSPMSMSYFADADRSMEVPILDLLAHYPQYMPQFFMHSQEKPPGPILFFRAILWLSGPSDRTALIAGILVGALATLAIPATYALIRVLLRDPDAAFIGCVLQALSPGLVLSFPMLDQIYPAMSCLLIIPWIVALRTQKVLWAILFGAVLAAACFVVYHFLVLGAFLTAATIAFIVPSPRQRIRQAIRLSLAAIITFVTIYLVLYVLTGFHFTRVFSQALIEQEKHLASLVRPYPQTILFDLTDFALGAGWLPVLLGLTMLADRSVSRERRGWAALCAGQILLLALIGLMQGETARIWCFLLPLMILPAAAELARWPRSARLVVFGLAWLLLCLVGQNLKFMY